MITLAEYTAGRTDVGGDPAQLENRIDRAIREHLSSRRAYGGAAPIIVQAYGYTASTIDHVIALYRAAGWLVRYEKTDDVQGNVVLRAA